MATTFAPKPHVVGEQRHWPDLFVERFEQMLAAEAGNAVRLAEINAEIERREEGRLRARLIRRLGISALETAWLDSALALHIRPALATALGARLLGEGRGVLSEQAVCELAGVPFQPLLRPGSPLLAWQLLQPGQHHPELGQGMRIDPTIAAALLGRLGMDRELAPFVDETAWFALELDSWPVETVAQNVTRLLRLERPVHLAIRGQAGSGRACFAAQLARHLRTQLVGVGADMPDDAHSVMLLDRLCLLSGQAPLLRSHAIASRCGERLPLVLQLLQPGELPAAAGEKAVLECDLPALSAEGKSQLWTALARQRDHAPVAIRTGPAPDLAPDLAAARFCDIAATARAVPGDAQEAERLLRQGRRSRLAATGNLLDLPYGWDDIVLTARQRDQLLLMVREMHLRDLMLDGAGKRAKYGGLGQSALFWGPPGTGKTMAAQVIARELGTDLLRVDLASVVSKFIGETAKNLRHIFAEVANTGALLVFDEADSLFARRTEVKDAHDRFANADTNYLLQLIESHDTATILLTNKKENIDPAFMRRMRHIADFPLAGPIERQELWQRHLLALSDEPPAENQLAKLCAALALVELTPAQIKGAALSAGFARLAEGEARIAVDGLLAGIERELDKDGQSFDRNLRKEIAAHG